MKEFTNSNLWWHGPKWLSRPEEEWPKERNLALTKEQEADIAKETGKPKVFISGTPSSCTKSRKARKMRRRAKSDLSDLNAPAERSRSARVLISVTLSNGIGTTEGSKETSVVERRSTLGSILRITAFVMRFVRVLRQRTQLRKTPSPPVRPITGGRIPLISAEEREGALLYWIRLAQQSYYPEEYNAALGGKLLAKKSELLALNAKFCAGFDDLLLRVQGRLAKTVQLPANARNPIIIPYQSTIAKRLIADAHLRTMHGTIQQMLLYLRNRYWIVNARRAARTYNSRCIDCFRQLQATATQQMAELPEVRITPARPFKHCGVDYAGPVTLRAYAGRCKKMTKGL